MDYLNTNYLWIRIRVQIAPDPIIIITKDTTGLCVILAATKQLYEWFSPSVCLSVPLSHFFYYVPIIVSSRNFQQLLPMTKVTPMQKVKVKSQGHQLVSLLNTLNFDLSLLC